ncbi:MAG: DUF4190 domain-containing protein [Acidimicrobiales bacterium]
MTAGNQPPPPTGAPVDLDSGDRALLVHLAERLAFALNELDEQTPALVADTVRSGPWAPYFDAPVEAAHEEDAARDDTVWLATRRTSIFVGREHGQWMLGDVGSDEPVDPDKEAPRTPAVVEALARQLTDDLNANTSTGPHAADLLFDPRWRHYVVGVTRQLRSAPGDRSVTLADGLWQITITEHGQGWECGGATPDVGVEPISGWWTATGREPPGSTNGLAIAALVLGILWMSGVGSIFALFFGYVALSQIRASGGRQGGRGLAVAGLVLGWVGVALAALLLLRLLG